MDLREKFEIFGKVGGKQVKACVFSAADFQLIVQACHYQSVRHEAQQRRKDYAAILKKLNGLKF